jgi:hypothetical protein
MQRLSKPPEHIGAEKVICQLVFQSPESGVRFRMFNVDLLAFPRDRSD